MDAIKEFREKANRLEKDLIASLGFELPEDVTWESAKIILNGIDDPIRTQILDRLITKNYKVSERSLYWIITGAIVQHNVRFGCANEQLESIICSFSNAMQYCSDITYELVNDVDRLHGSRFNYLNQCVSALIYGMHNDWDSGVDLVNVQNFASFGSEYGWDGSSKLVSIPNRITDCACSLAAHSPNQPAEADLVRRIEWADSKTDIHHIKRRMLARARMMELYCEIVQNHFK